MNSLFESEQNKSLAALDKLFLSVKAYRSSHTYLELMRFICRLPQYSPYNCFLLHTQNPNVSYVATAGQWARRFGRRIIDRARPLVILAPMSPVLFVFDVVDTEGDPLPEGLLAPFATTGKLSETVWKKTINNLFQDRIRLLLEAMHHSKAGWIMRAQRGDTVSKKDETVPALYRMQINSALDKGAQYATLTHELGHLYAGHLGTPNEKWWPDRSHLGLEEREFEAESICYLICQRAGIANPSDAYLAGYMQSRKDIPEISFDRVLKVAGLIESMGKYELRSHPQKGNDGELPAANKRG
jgi:hypothetical protein